MRPDLSDSLTAARELLGCKLSVASPEGIASGYIVETEAYDMSDPASHTYKGETVRNSAMFRPAGTVYVYFTYGMHFCMNIVTGEAGHGQGVLLRALEPVEGIDLMRSRRGVKAVEQLASGPAKLTQALGINRLDNMSKLNDGRIRLEAGFLPGNILQTTRIGISQAKDQPWRFLVAGSRYVSRPAR
jgi:DNA-3-methyladenine glycosylase